jgi:SAM-dependent methyltransferase
VRRLLARFLDRFAARTLALRPTRIVDLGAGEGHGAKHLRAILPYPFEYRGLEINPAALALARQRCTGMRFEQADLLVREPEEGWADLALCLEVLEHLAEPEAAVRRIAQWTARHALISVPWEPFFQAGNLARGKYLSRLGNHPEHCQRFTPRRLSRLLGRHFASVQIEGVFPWLLAVAEKGGRG